MLNLFLRRASCRSVVLALLVLSAAGFFSGCAAPTDPDTSIAPAQNSFEPIIFVPGNGDNRSVWMTTAWRFESNGWPRDRLFCVDLDFPTARSDDTVPAPGRSGSAEFEAALASEVDHVRAVTGARKVILIGLSRGGYPIRSYVAHTGGEAVSKVILGGTPNHGVFVSQSNLNSEFNGAGAYLLALNRGQGPDALEVTPGVPTMTVRSDANDKYAQPLGVGIGAPTTPTGVSAEGPALRGALNVVLPGADHRETATSEAAFEQDFKFLTGHLPGKTAIVREPNIVLDGRVNALWGTEPINRPMAGAKLTVYRVSPEDGTRIGGPVLERIVGEDGRWGPLRVSSEAYHEFVIMGDGCATTHVYRSPFVRSSNWVDLHCVRETDDAKASALQSVIAMIRPRGYFGLNRDQIMLDGAPAPGIAPGVPTVAISKITVTNRDSRSTRTVVAQFNGERIAVQSWPVADRHAVVAEFHY